MEYEFRDYKGRVDIFLPTELTIGSNPKSFNPLGTAHGFAARPNLEVPDVKEGYEKAFQQTVDWFRKTLPNLN